MYLDHHLACHFGGILDKPLLRFFTWNPYCISLGYHQDPSDINQEMCRSETIDLVRRPTGGRAILHAEELTYSVIYPFRGQDIGEFYRLVHLPFMMALNDLKVPAQFEPVQADFPAIYKTDRAYLCFATSAKHELEISGKKLMGSAQRVYEKSILQHGSLLLGPGHERLVDFLTITEEKRRHIRQYIQEHTECVGKHLQEISAERLSKMIQAKFAENFGIRFIPWQENLPLKNVFPDALDNSDFSIVRNRVTDVVGVAGDFHNFP